jgi:hypothetical protein
MSRYNAVYMSLNDRKASTRNIEDAISLSICKSGMSLVDLTRDDDDAGSNSAVRANLPTLVVSWTS